MGLLALPPAPQDGQSGGLVPAPPQALADLLPVTGAAWRWLPGRHFLAAAPRSRGHGVMAGVLGSDFSGSTGAESGGLASLPPLRLMIEVEAAAEATVLLQTPKEGGAWRPLLVVGSSGQGRSAWYGGRNLWETAFWERSAEPGQTRTKAHPGRRLLRNLMVWVATGEQASGLALRGPAPVFQEGQPIRLEAVWRDMRGEPVIDRTIDLVVRPADSAADSSAARTFRFGNPDSRTGLAAVEVGILPPGSYSVQLVGDGPTPARSLPELLVVTRHTVEATQVRQDRRRLVQLAASAGGGFAGADDQEGVAALVADLQDLPWQGEQRRLRARYEIWSGWPFLLTVVALLGLEWYLRRRNGLL